MGFVVTPLHSLPVPILIGYPVIDVSVIGIYQPQAVILVPVPVHIQITDEL